MKTRAAKSTPLNRAAEIRTEIRNLEEELRNIFHFSSSGRRKRNGDGKVTQKSMP
jgi:hypothetical protein